MECLCLGNTSSLLRLEKLVQWGNGRKTMMRKASFAKLRSLNLTLQGRGPNGSFQAGGNVIRFGFKKDLIASQRKGRDPMQGNSLRRTLNARQKWKGLEPFQASPRNH